MLNPRALTHAQLAAIVADVQAILWQESRPIPDFPREYGDYWSPAKEWEAETVEEIADVLEAARLHPGRLGRSTCALDGDRRQPTTVGGADPGQPCPSAPQRHS